MTEETKNASVAGPVGIVASVVVSFVFGLIYIIGLLFALPSIDQVVNGGGLIVIFQTSVGQSGAVLLSIIVIGAMFFCGMASLTSNSRMMYAFARDGAIPMSHVWHQINPDTFVPSNSVWLGVLLAFMLSIPIFFSLGQPLSDGVPVAFTAIVSIAVIGLYISYVIPVFLRNTIGRSSFRPGPISLGSFSPVIGWISIVWVCFITIVFILPTSLPVEGVEYDWASSINYTGPMVLIFMSGVMGWYYIGAHKWFTGPKIIGRKESGETVPGSD